MSKIAIVGSGVSGLAAAWLLTEHSDHTVEIFEKGEYVGGHTHTIDYVPPGPKDVGSVPVDTGFIVFNNLTYPNLINFLNHKRVPFVGSEMTFSVTRDNGKFEWAGSNLITLFAQWENLFRLGHWRMIYDILRFNSLSTDILNLPTGHPHLDMTLEQYLDKHGYSSEFRNDYLLPMAAAIWSTPPDKCALDFPALTLIRFMHNHCLLQIADRPQWLTVANGSREYINALLPILPKIQTSTAVSSIKRTPHGTQLTTSTGHTATYDHVIFACHADETLAILGSSATELERKVLGDVRFSRNEIYVHADLAYMPRRRLAWASWNYLSITGKDADPQDQDITLTYWMNNLQRWLPSEPPILVTMNPPAPGPSVEKTMAQYSYMHPTYTPQLITAQAYLRLPRPKGQQSIQGNGTWFAGAWTGYGFHEDGFTSGLLVAMGLGAKAPFKVEDRRYEEGTRDARAGVLSTVVKALWWRGIDEAMRTVVRWVWREGKKVKRA